MALRPRSFVLRLTEDEHAALAQEAADAAVSTAELIRRKLAAAPGATDTGSLLTRARALIDQALRQLH